MYQYFHINHPGHYRFLYLMDMDQCLHKYHLYLYRYKGRLDIYPHLHKHINHPGHYHFLYLMDMDLNYLQPNFLGEAHILNSQFHQLLYLHSISEALHNLIHLHLDHNKN